MAEETQNRAAATEDEVKTRPSDTITIRKGDDEARVVRSAFEKVWSQKGWEIVDEDAQRAQAPARGGSGTAEQDAAPQNAPKDAPSQTARGAQETKKS